MFELSFFPGLRSAGRGRVFSEAEILAVRQPAGAGLFLPMPPCAALRGSPMLQGWTLRKPKWLSGARTLDQKTQRREPKGGVERETRSETDTTPKTIYLVISNPQFPQWRGMRKVFQNPTCDSESQSPFQGRPQRGHRMYRNCNEVNAVNEIQTT